MYRVEMIFDTDRLGCEAVEDICTKTDEIFGEENISCERKSVGERVYVDNGDKTDFGRLWAALFAIKDTPLIAGSLKECFWQKGAVKENLITDFFNS